MEREQLKEQAFSKKKKKKIREKKKLSLYLQLHDATANAW